MLAYIPFFKVILLSIGLLDSTIVDERHFTSRLEAETFANQHKQADVVAVIVSM